MNPFVRDAAVFPRPLLYEFEAQPSGIIEVMRAGCCVISTNYKYILELYPEEPYSGDKGAIYNEINGALLTWGNGAQDRPR